MENNKIKMPPPPKELRNMPAPPPKMPPKEVVEEKIEEKVEEVKLDPVVDENVDNLEHVEVEAVKDEGAKKSTSNWKKTAYWAGFAVSLIAMGILVYLLIK